MCGGPPKSHGPKPCETPWQLHVRCTDILIPTLPRGMIISTGYVLMALNAVHKENEKPKKEKFGILA